MFKFETLKIWKEAIQFASQIYSLSKKFPKNEEYGLTSQLNRAAVSVSLNIAEGEGRGSDADLARFIHIAIGSLYEVVTILHIALDQKYLSKTDFESFYNKSEELSKMLHGYKNYIKH